MLNYRTFKCERSERTYNFDYVRRKRMDGESYNPVIRQKRFERAATESHLNHKGFSVQ